MPLQIHHIARAGIGYVPEERGIFAGLTVEENVTLPPKVTDGGMTIDEIYALIPNLLERRTSQGTNLSGGEQQMLAMARVLRVLKRNGMTILLAEKNFAFAQGIADRFLVMEHGHIIDMTNAHELASRKSALQTYLGV
jgi:branched-chain amino acid transport system ATP-binding protein